MRPQRGMQTRKHQPRRSVADGVGGHRAALGSARTALVEGPEALGVEPDAVQRLIHRHVQHVALVTHPKLDIAGQAARLFAGGLLRLARGDERYFISLRVDYQHARPLEAARGEVNVALGIDRHPVAAVLCTEVYQRAAGAADQALLIEFGTEISPRVNLRVRDFCRWASSRKIPGIGEMIPSYCTVLVYYDPFLLSFAETEAWIREFAGSPRVLDEGPPPVKEVPVLYGGEYGPDLSFVARHNGIAEEEVIRLHSSQDFLVYVVGFSPGFAAMGIVPPRIQAPRLASPRTKVPAGSVGIGGMQTGIYAVESPGGWQLIGRTPLKLFDLAKNPPSFFRAGDYARFCPIDEKEFLRLGKVEV